MKKGILAGISLLTGAAAGALFVSKNTPKKDSGSDNRLKSYYDILNQWLIVKQKGNNLEKYFEENQIHKIAIYGMGQLGWRLYDELQNTGIEIAYVIDQNAVINTHSDLIVYETEDDLPEVDAIIVTAVFAFDEIQQKLSGQISYPILSLEEVVYAI